MGAEALTQLVCPRCRAPLEGLACRACGARYGSDDGIPVLVSPSALAGGKRRQAAWFDQADAEYEVERPVGTPAFHGWLLAEKFRRGTDAIADELPGATALAVCGGSGMDAEFLARAGARPFSADLSVGAARRVRERARRHGLAVETIVADAEALPLADRSVDVVYVHDGLHHLERPLAALEEMARVARRAVSVNEPAQAALTSAAVRAGLALEREEAGNPVRRLTLVEIERVLAERGFTVVRARRYAMRYGHEPGAPSRLLSRRRLQPVAERALLALDPLAARVGNKLTVQAVRDTGETRFPP